MKDFSAVTSAGVDAGDLLDDLGEAGGDLRGCSRAVPLGGAAVRRRFVSRLVTGIAGRVTGRGRPARRRSGRRRSRRAAPGRRTAPRRRSTISVSASGIDADEVLPDSTMSSATTRVRRRRACLAIASMMRRLAWCGTNTSMSAGLDAGQLGSARARPGRSAVVAQRKTAWPSWWRYGLPARRSRWRRRSSPALPQTTGPMPGLVGVGRADDRGAGAVGEDDRGRAVVPVDPVGELLGADHQHVARPRRRGSPWSARGQRVAEAGAGGVEVERAGRRDAEPVGDLGGRVRDRRRQSCRWRR